MANPLGDAVDFKILYLEALQAEVEQLKDAHAALLADFRTVEAQRDEARALADNWQSAHEAAIRERDKTQLALEVSERFRLEDGANHCEELAAMKSQRDEARTGLAAANTILEDTARERDEAQRQWESWEMLAHRMRERAEKAERELDYWKACAEGEIEWSEDDLRKALRERVVDVLALQAIQDDDAGLTRPLRDYAAERGIDLAEKSISLTCHCCGGDSSDWTGYYSAERTEETRVFLCSNCNRIFLMQVMDDLNHSQCLEYLGRAKKDLRPGDLPKRREADEHKVFD
jgi:hypothetical protein